MPKVLYNEGRICGYSAYEIFLQQGGDPEIPEKHWLASTIAMGSSMLLRVGADSAANISGGDIEGFHFRDIPLPLNTNLCAANTVIGSFFSGSGQTPSGITAESTYWADRVTDYGALISNTGVSSPSGTNAPVQNPLSWSSERQNQLKEYVKIVDGIIIQPGDWSDNSPNKPPEKKLEPAFNKSPAFGKPPKLRLLFNRKITQPFWILLTGFTVSGVIKGTSWANSSVSTHPQDGDFLGPAVFPWSSKVIFSMPSAYASLFMTGKYARKLPKTAAAETVKSDPVIDMTKTNPKTFYENHYQDAKADIEVTAINSAGEDLAVLTVYQRDALLPPALFGSKVSENGVQSIYPIDTAAPGTLKLYHGDNGVKAKNLEDNTPHNTGFMRNSSTYVVNERNADGDIVPVSEDTTPMLNNIYLSGTPYIWPQIQQSYDALGGNVSSAVMQVLFYGFVNQKFMEKYCVDYKTMINSALTKPDQNGITFYAIFADQIPENKRNEYVFFIRGAISDHPNQQYFCIPVHKSGRINLMSPIALNYPGLTDKLPASEVIFPPEYVGTWFGSAASTADPNLGTHLGLTEHPLTRAAIRSSDMFYQATSLTPKPPASYGYDYLAWFKNTPVMTRNGMQGMWSSSYMDSLNIHNDYRSMSVADFMLALCTRDVTKSIASNSMDYTIDVNWDIYNKSIFTEVKYIEGNPPKWDKTYTHDIRVNFKLLRRNILISNPSDLPAEYLANNTIRLAKSQSGNEFNIGIALYDEYKQLLPLVGVVSDISAEKINWFDLLLALNRNESVDLLGQRLRELKTALTNVTNNRQFALTLGANSEVTVTPVRQNIPNFFNFHIVCDPANASTNPYNDGVIIDIFGYSRDGDSPTTYGTITTLNNSSLTVSTSANWFQKLIVSGENLTELKGLAASLKKNAAANYDTLKISIVPRPSYRSGSGAGKDGYPTANEMVVMTCYFDLTNLESKTAVNGILFVRNNGHVLYIASGAYMCAASLTNETNIWYDPGTGHTWTDQ